MTVSAFRFTVGSAAVAVHPVDFISGGEVHITNTTAEPVSLGPFGVTAGTGFLLAGNTSVSVKLGPGDSLWVIRDGGVNGGLSVLHT